MKKLTLICFLILCFCGSAFAQGEDSGVKKSTPRSPVKTVPKTAPKTTAPKTSAKSKPAAVLITVKKAAVKKPTVRNTAEAAYGNLNINVNEPNSEVFLSDANGNVLEEESYFTDGDGSPLELEDVSAGVYQLIVRKYGYAEESRQIRVTGGKLNTIDVVLKSSGALLSINTDPAGANVEIVGVGEYNSKIENLVLAPGKYTVYAYKKGYLTESREIALDTAGQKQQLDISLKYFPLQESLADAERSLAARNLSAADNVVRKILAASPDNAKASLLAGSISVGNSDPQDGVFYFSRAVSMGETAAIPAKIYNKGDSEMQLISGNLMFSTSSLEFRSTARPELNFSLSPESVSELFEKPDDFGMTAIVIKARAEFNGKTEKRTIMLYPGHAALRSSPKELFCAGCTQLPCSCTSEERCTYGLINRWRNKDLSSQQTGFGTVLPPSEEFVREETANFTVKLPENWQVLENSDTDFLAAPAGGFVGVQEKYNYSHGVSISVISTPQTSLLLAHASNLQRIVKANTYLQPGSDISIKLTAGNALMTRLSGRSPVSGQQETVTVYTLLTSLRKGFTIITVTPPEQADAYENTFRRIVNSINLK
jgi:PEGA domain